MSVAELLPEMEVRAVSMEVGQAAIRTSTAKKAAAQCPEGGAGAWVEEVVVVVGAAEVVAERRQRISTWIWTRKTMKM